MKLITWNMAHRVEAWRHLLATGCDVALLQEAAEPPDDVSHAVRVDAAPWQTAGADARRPWRTAIAVLSRNVAVEWFETKSLEYAKSGDLAVSRPGTLAAATVSLEPDGSEPLIVISAYALWERPHISAGANWIYADASVHRLISDISALIGQQRGHRILVAGDLNILYGYGDNGSPYWGERYATVFSRMAALGLAFVGPQTPGGRCTDPWPDELPRSSKNVPTFYASHQNPATATRQLDFVFASRDLADRVRVRALNDSATWGPSDHCCVEIEIDL